MPWSDFAKIWKIQTVDGVSNEDRGHRLEITGTQDHPLVACRTDGCVACYHDTHFQDQPEEQLTGRQSAGGLRRGFTITYDEANQEIDCQIGFLDNSGTTGSWTADDRGPDPGDGDRDRPPHRHP